VLETNIRPTDIQAAEKLFNEHIPNELTIRGIDNAFDNYKPKYEGDKINSFSFCVPIIRSLYEKSKAKEDTNSGGTNIDGGHSEDATKFYSRGLD
jgi:hypothetical protein